MSQNKLVQLLNQYNHTHTILETGRTINIRPITTGQMKSVLQYEGSDDIEVVDAVLDDIINGCVVTEDFNIDDLTIQDRFELLIAIRQISKGNEYNFTIKCPKCGVESIQIIDISKLEVVQFPQKIERKVVINNNLTANLDFIRRGHQKQTMDIVGKIKGLSENQKLSEIATYLYTFGITSFETNTGKIDDISIEDKKEFLDNLSEKTYTIINEWYEKYSYGTKFVYNLVCNAGTTCDFNKEENIPLSGFFF